MSRPHVAALVEDTWHSQLERGLRRRGWENRIIGHVGYGSPSFIRVFARVLLGRARDEGGDSDEPDPTYGGMRSPFLRDRGWRAFVTAPGHGRPVSVRVDGRTFHARSDRSGHIDATFRDHGLEPGWQRVTSPPRAPRTSRRRSSWSAREVSSGLVSDIDDTVITTMLPRTMIAAWNTFVRHEGARRVVPGMAPMYRELLAEHPGAPDRLRLDRRLEHRADAQPVPAHGTATPPGHCCSPTGARPTPGGSAAARSTSAPACTGWPRLPDIRWLLIGDDGQHDPKIYQEFAEARPGPVDAIAIRQLTPTEQVLSHGLPVSNEELQPARHAGAARRAGLLRAGRLRPPRDPPRAGKGASPARPDHPPTSARSPRPPTRRAPTFGSPTRRTAHPPHRPRSGRPPSPPPRQQLRTW